jgi:disulfide bond formation protein DsbB
MSRTLNLLALAGICAALAFALAWQLYFNEIPCPLCLLQRVAFILVGIGLLLNVRFGPSPLHYGIIILSALGGVAAAGRQVLLHITPGDAGYGSPFLGLHFYTWALVLFVAFIAYCGVMLALDRNSAELPARRHAGPVTKTIMWFFLMLVVANTASTLLECGFGACPDDPVGYLWLPR